MNIFFFFFQAEDGIRDATVTGVQTCALPISSLSASQDRDSRTAITRRPLTAKAVREAAFKYNGVPDFCEFLAALPANVSVFDPKLGRSRTLVQGGHVLRTNVTWLSKRQKMRPKPNDRTVVSVEELGTRNSGI